MPLLWPELHDPTAELNAESCILVSIFNLKPPSGNLDFIRIFTPDPAHFTGCISSLRLTGATF